MIERRRLFFRSDFPRDITQPALFRKLLCSLRVIWFRWPAFGLPDPETGQTDF